MTTLESIIIAVIVLLVAFIVWVSYNESQKETIEIIKDEWVCSRTDTRTVITPIYSGKTVIMIPSTKTDCVEYKRREF